MTKNGQRQERRVGRAVDELEQYAVVFSALSEPIRIEMIRLMSTTDELPCTTLAERLPISKSTISYHIKILYQAGLISVRKDGRNFHYRLLRHVLDEDLPAFATRLREPEAVGPVS